jgi:hypothetical protein
MPKPASSTRSALLLLAVAVMCGLAILPASAGASVAIEGVWSFKGGAIDVVSQPNGTLLGVVSAPIKFAECPHPVNEHIWTEMTPQADGSYWGLHRWYFKNCPPNPVYGKTAWRLLENAKKTTFLRVCFSAPEKSQPTISADGTPTDASFGCFDSEAISELPVTPRPKGTRALFNLPSAKICLKAAALRIGLHNPPYDPLKQVTVWVNGKKVLNLHTGKKLGRPIMLSHLPSGKVKVKVLAITILNHRVTTTRVYHRCKSRHHAKGKHH